MARSPSGTFDPRYLVVAGACIVQFTVIGGVFAYGIFFKVLEDEFGWSRTLLSSCTSAAFLVMGVLAIAAGRLNDRFGPRRVMAISGVIYGIGYLLLAQISAPWELLVLYGAFVGVGLSTHDVVTLSTIAKWFENRRGIMTGVVKVGTASGQVLVPPFAAFLILGFGWRNALEIMGILAIILLLLAAYLLKSPPVVSVSGGKAPRSGMSFEQARKTRQFWTLCLVQFLFFPSLVTIPLHIAVHGQDLGLSTATAALLLSVMGGCSVVGRLTVGGFVDRIGGRKSYVICFVPLIASLTGFLLTRDTTLLFVLVAIYGFGHGGFFTVVSPTIAEFFGMQAHGTLFGIIVFSGTIAAAFGPILAGLIFDVYGSFGLAFGVLAGLACVGLLLVLSLRPIPALSSAAAE